MDEMPDLFDQRSTGSLECMRNLHQIHYLSLFSTESSVDRCKVVGRMSKRRTKQRMTAIHMSIPVRLLEDFDETLAFSQSRSAKISTLIQKELEGEDYQGISEASTRQLMAALSSRDDVDMLMKSLLLQILTNPL